MKGIILAAGDGGRLLPLTLTTPKVMLEVAGRPLIQYPLDALHASGIDDIAVVLGYQSDIIIDAFKRGYGEFLAPTFIVNSQYQGENALSLWAARDFVGDDPFVLCMGDHIIHPGVITRLLDLDYDGCVLGVDLAAHYPFQVDDATRVLVSPSGEVEAIGKDLETWNAIDIGVFMLTNRVFTSISHLRRFHGVGVQLSHIVRFLVQNNEPFGTCDMSGLFWGDVDTQEDYELIKRIIGGNHGSGL